MFNKMPELDLSICNLTAEELNIAKYAIKGDKLKGTLRASKPKEQKHSIRIEPEFSPEKQYLKDISKFKHTHKNAYATEDERSKALGIYVWRELAFVISPISSHHCMPICNDFNLEYDYGDERRKQQMNFCNNIVNKILKTIRPESCHGLKRWAKALGMGI